MVSRGTTFGDYFKPYNNVLSTTPIAIYRILVEIFGLQSYVPYRLVVIVASAAIALAMFLLVRSRVGPVAALVAGTAMLCYPSFAVVVASVNHYLAILGCIGCAWFLSKSGAAADLALGLVLAFALCSAGKEPPGAVACIVFLALPERGGDGGSRSSSLRQLGSCGGGGWRRTPTTRSQVFTTASPRSSTASPIRFEAWWAEARCSVHCSHSASPGCSSSGCEGACMRAPTSSRGRLHC